MNRYLVLKIRCRTLAYYVNEAAVSSNSPLKPPLPLSLYEVASSPGSLETHIRLKAAVQARNLLILRHQNANERNAVMAALAAADCSLSRLDLAVFDGTSGASSPHAVVVAPSPSASASSVNPGGALRSDSPTLRSSGSITAEQPPASTALASSRSASPTSPAPSSPHVVASAASAPPATVASSSSTPAYPAEAAVSHSEYAKTQGLLTVEFGDLESWKPGPEANRVLLGGAKRALQTLITGSRTPYKVSSNYCLPSTRFVHCLAPFIVARFALRSASESALSRRMM